VKRQKIFIGVAWPYVNGDLHIGHIDGYLLPADIFARFNRYIGNEVLMVSGSDCHGTPITVEAEKLGISPQEVVNLYHPKDVKLFKFYGLSFDIYTKTTTENHKKVVQDLFIRLAKNGYLSLGKSLQYYSEKEKRFLPDRYVEGKCPYCGFKGARSDQCADGCGRILNPGELIDPKSKLSNSPVIFKETEHYYFDLPKLAPFLKKYVNKHKNNWRGWVAKETLGWLKEGLEKRAITRDLDWGVEIPVDQLPANLRIENAENKRVYVWFEAVIGYLSAAIEWAGKTDKWKDFWYNKETKHYYFMGQDNLVFHTIFWPAQLYGAFGNKIHLPDFPIINQFLNFEGEKFSKSRGLTVDSYYLGKTYGVDTVRFYIALIMSEYSSANFSWDHFVETNNKVLIGTFGNFINRVLSLSKDIEDFDKTDLNEKVLKDLKKMINNCYQNVAKCECKLFAQSVINLADYGNKYLNVQSPWKLEKTSSEYKKVMTNALAIVLAINLVAKPLIPTTMEKLSKMIGVGFDQWLIGKEIDQIKKSLAKIKITNIKPLFNKIDPSVVGKERAKIKFPQKTADVYIIVGKILTLSPHPNADKLQVVKVDIGKKRILNIVCGAANIKIGDIVPVVLPGGKVKTPNNEFAPVEKRPVRGIVSEGMLCSALELGINQNHEEIYILPQKLGNKLGQPFTNSNLKP